MGKDERRRAKREEEFYWSNPVQRRQVCGRQFIKRQEAVCSIACLERSKESDEN